MQAALSYLVLAEDLSDDDELIKFQDLEYARRHSLPFFQDALSKYPSENGSLKSQCMPHPIQKIAANMYFLDQHGEFKSDIPSIDVSNNQFPTVYSVVNEQGDYIVPVFEIMTRGQYIDATSCLVSPTTYRKYYLAYFQSVLGWGHRDEAVNNMRQFLTELAEGAHTGDGLLDSRCMTNSIQVLAEDLNLLDNNGDFKIN